VAVSFRVLYSSSYRFKSPLQDTAQAIPPAVLDNLNTNPSKPMQHLNKWFLLGALMTVVKVLVVVAIRVVNDGKHHREGKFRRLLTFMVGTSMLGITASLASMETGNISTVRIILYLCMTTCAAYWHYKAMFYPLWKLLGSPEPEEDEEWAKLAPLPDHPPALRKKVTPPDKANNRPHEKPPPGFLGGGFSIK